MYHPSNRPVPRVTSVVRCGRPRGGRMLVDRILVDRMLVFDSVMLSNIVPNFLRAMLPRWQRCIATTASTRSCPICVTLEITAKSPNCVVAFAPVVESTGDITVISLCHEWAHSCSTMPHTAPYTTHQPCSPTHSTAICSTHLQFLQIVLTLQITLFSLQHIQLLGSFQG
jgi:hypothetical protein